jgi:hypothetical protein
MEEMCTVKHVIRQQNETLKFVRNTRSIIQLKGHITDIGEMTNAYKVSVGKPEGKTMSKTHEYMER